MAAVRSIVQLMLIGFVLKFVFSSWNQWYFVLALLVVMTVIAGISAVGRTERRYKGIYGDSLLAMFGSSWLVAAYALFALLRDHQHTWLHAQYAIPLTGMILGNSLTGISLGLNRLSEQFFLRRDEIETRLALGATRWEASRDCVRNAVHSGMTPIINSMMVVGIVSLPGMMTGQLLSGVEPLQAVRYQIVILFLIAAATALGTVGVVMLSYRRMVNAQHQLTLNGPKSP